MYYYTEYETRSIGLLSFLKGETKTMIVKSSTKEKAETKLKKYLDKKFKDKKMRFKIVVHDTI